MMGPAAARELEPLASERPTNGHAANAREFALAINNIQVDSSSPLPIYEQITLALRSAVCAGDLPQGTMLPTSRDLANFLGVSRNTVGLAYSRLVAEGYLVSHRRRGTHVAQNGAALLGSVQPRPMHVLPGGKDSAGSADRAHAFPVEPAGQAVDVCSPDNSLYPRMSLGRLLSQEFGRPPSPNANCLARFQVTMASHLRQTRGVRCQAEQVIPLANVQCALDLTAQVLIDRGHSVHLEDPIASSIRATFVRAGAWTFPLTNGNPAFMQEGAPPRLIVVSPSNNIPLGTQMPAHRRLDILSAAKQGNAIVVEYDLGHDLIFAGSRGAAIQALGGEDHVIYLGSLCDTLGPYIQLTYLVVPADLVEPFYRTAFERGYIPESYLLAALAAFIGDTKYAMHLKTLRGTYGERAVLMAEACRARFGVASMMQPVGGLCASLRLPLGTNEAKLCHAARLHGISVAPLSRFYQSKPAFPGAVFGLGSISDRLIGPMLSRFAELVEETSVSAEGA